MVSAGLAAMFVLAGGQVSIPTAATQPGAKAPEELQNLAVLDFAVIGTGVDPAIGEALASVIQSALVRGGGVRLIERSELAAVLKEQDLQLTDMVDPATAVEVGRIAGVDRLVVGSVAAVAKTYTVTFRVVDVTTGEAGQAEEFTLQTLEKYPELGRLLAALIGEQLVGEDSIALAPYWSESFEGKDCRLTLGISEKSQSGALLEQGRYVLVKSNPGNQYSWLPKGKERFCVQVDLTHEGGSLKDGCGLVWGAQDNDAYLSVWINGDRDLAIERRQGGTANTFLLRKRDWDAMRRPPRSNRLRVESWDDRHRVFVNGVCVDEFYEPGFRGGKVGLRVFQRKDGEPSRWAVDNLTLSELAPSLAGILTDSGDVAEPPRQKVKKKKSRRRVAGSAHPWAKVHNVRVNREDHGETPGIRVRAALEVGNCRGAKLRAVAQFVHAGTGKPLRDRDQRYSAADGRVIAERNFSPRHRLATYADFGLYIPVGQLHLPPGRFDLKCRVVVLDVSGERPVRLARSEDIVFPVAKN
jgi:hypothetical protein